MEAGYAAVTGTSSCPDELIEGVGQFTALPYTLTGKVHACDYAMSDPRVSGTGTLDINIETWDPALTTRPGTNMVLWGGQTIEGPEGTWSGRHYGFYDEQGVVHDVSVLAGNGAYEGWTFVFSTTVPSGTTGDVIGVIHHSSPPPGYPVEPFPAPSASASR
jgi:hypothetical protein